MATGITNNEWVQLQINFEEKNLLGARILLADDNHMNIMIVRELLKKWNAIVDCCESGFDTIALVLKRKYDLILMDLEMPGINGIEATEQIRKTDKTIPVIAFTASASEETKEKVLKSKMTFYITKPFKGDELYKTIKKYLNPE
jgi:CheY-like chemotaxis protein